MLSEGALDAAISSDINFQVHAEPGLLVNAYQLRVHTSICPHEGDGIYYSPWHLLEATLGPAQPIWNRFLNRGRDEIRVGPVVFVPRDEPVHCRFTRGARRTVSCLFDLEALGFERAASWDWQDLDPALAFDVRDSFVQMAVQRLRQEALAPSFASETQVDCALIFLAAQLQRLIGTRDRVDSRESDILAGAPLQKVLAVINDGDGPSPTVYQLARSAGLSAPVFSMRFRNAMGQTLRSYVANVKLDRAKQLLLDETQMIKQIAYRCGFSSAAAFSMAFRQETGLTPTQYRNTARLN